MYNCGDKLVSRQEISSHRESKHQMFRIANCKYFPGCIDEDECFFKHENKENQNSYFCSNGENCSDQS